MRGQYQHDKNKSELLKRLQQPSPFERLRAEKKAQELMDAIIAEHGPEAMAIGVAAASQEQGDLGDLWQLQQYGQVIGILEAML